MDSGSYVIHCPGGKSGVEDRRNIGWRLEEMREDLRGDVLKLQSKGN